MREEDRLNDTITRILVLGHRGTTSRRELYSTFCPIRYRECDARRGTEKEWNVIQLALPAVRV